jgi:tRNA A-37 threonylcarbamoyl transferase component Bud32
MFLSYKFVLHPSYSHFEDKLLNISSIFDSSDKSIHKARNELKIIEINQLECVVKSFKIPHLINRVAYSFFRDGKAKKSFLNAVKLQELGVNTPEPVGYIEFFSQFLLRESYFISMYKPYDFTIREVFHHKIEDRENILKSFANFSFKLHQKGVWHVDYSLGNILIVKNKSDYEFFLVDINRMIFKDIPPKEGLKNFNKFWAKDREDLVIIAKEYAKLAKLDESEAVDIVLNEADKLEAKVNLKRKLKAKS